MQNRCCPWSVFEMQCVILEHGTTGRSDQTEMLLRTFLCFPYAELIVGRFHVAVDL